MNYRDRRRATWVDVFETTPAASFFRYSRPQEMGNRTDVQYATFSAGTTPSGNAPSLAVASASPLAPFEFSAIPWTSQEIIAAKSLDRLPADDEKIIVNIDAFQMGLGGASCGPRPMAQYQTLSAPVALGFSLSAFPQGEKFSAEKLRSRHFVPHSPVIDRDDDGNVVLRSSTPEAKFFVSKKTNDDAGKAYTGVFPFAQGKIRAWAADTSAVPATPEETRELPPATSVAQWKIFSVSSEEPGSGDANFAIDRDAGTFWHSASTNAQPDYPHSLAVDTGAKTRFSGFILTPRMDSNSGLILDYAFSVSDDGKTWKTVKRGKFSYHYIRKDPAVQRVDFDKPVEARYFKIDALSPVRPEKFASIAEISLIAQ